MTAPAIDVDELADFCATTFESLPRSDQRRCAKVYVQGLLECDGRRSSQRIASEVPGSHNGQSLQQFVNQSPWNPQPIRRRMVDLALAHGEPAGWVLEQVVFPKSGRCSAAVERQYARALGRVANCQMGAVLTVTGPALSVPVNWRLCLPESWDADERRRANAHIPAHERHRPYWHYLVDLVDEMTVSWNVPAAPVVTDMSACPGAEQLMTQLDNRDLGYLVRVNGTHRVRGRLRRGGGPVAELRDIVRMAATLPRRTMVWIDARRREVRSQFVCFPIREDVGGPAPQHVLVDWPFGRDRPRAMWLTNLIGWALGDLVALSRLGDRAREAIRELTESFGLCHHEGRSFIGWHHHVTLVSVAYGFHARRRHRQRRDESDRPDEPSERSPRNRSLMPQRS